MRLKLNLFGFHRDSGKIESLFMEGAASPLNVDNQESSAFYVNYTGFTACFLYCSVVSRCTPDLVMLDGDYFAAIPGDVGLCTCLIEHGPNSCSRLSSACPEDTKVPPVLIACLD